jgi:hypothetical protein
MCNKYVSSRDNSLIHSLTLSSTYYMFEVLSFLKRNQLAQIVVVLCNFKDSKYLIFLESSASMESSEHLEHSNTSKDYCGDSSKADTQ